MLGCLLAEVISSMGRPCQNKGTRLASTHVKLARQQQGCD